MSMAYMALYRRWRPTGFNDLVGQGHVSRTLGHAIRTEHVGHAYLFAGPRGTGKTSTAKILAKALNCDEGPTTEPCNKCESCRRVNDGTSMDVFEIDAASNRGIDEIRELRETVKFAPVDGRYKVYIIDEVHMLTTEAFNALLKTLEEPPARVVFILATTEIHKVPATIQSRCQRYDFKRITAADITARLRYVADNSDIQAEDAALALIAREADGGMRDALSTLDQCAALTAGTVTEAEVRELLGLVGRDWLVRLARGIATKDAQGLLAAVGELIGAGKDLRQLVAELIAELRAVMVFQAAGALEGASLYETDEELLRELAGLFAPADFAGILQTLHGALAELKWSTEPRITVETALLSLCHTAAGGQSTAAPAQAVPVAPAAPVTQLPERPTTVLAQGMAAGSAETATLKTKIYDLEQKLNRLAQKMSEMLIKPSAPVKQAPRPAYRASAINQNLKPPAAPDERSMQIWTKINSELQGELVGPQKQMLAQTIFRGVDGTHFFLEAADEWTANYFSGQAAFRSKIENAFSTSIMRTLSLVVVMPEQQKKAQAPVEDIPEAPPPPEDEDYIPNLDDFQGDARHALEGAMQIFGNNFVPPPEGDMR